ncbi:FecR domain-containing protein [Cystobacter fuscus]
MPRNSNVRVFCLLLFLVLGPPDVARAQQADDDVYVVQPGDTCASVGRRFFGDASAGSAKLHALNAMGPPPHTLKPGTRLRIKGDPDARLTFVKPEVNSKRAGKPDWLQANTGQGLWRLDSVNTLRSAGAEVTFRDLTRLQMNENALVVIYGQETQAPDKVKKSGAVELLQGELNVSLAELRGEPLGVKMPAASVDSRSRDLIVGVDAQQMTRLSVFDGQAEVAAQGQRVQVPRDHGTRVEKGKVPEKPRPLPEAPEWVGGVRSVRLLLDGAGVDETLPWAPVPRAASYRVELARDERFNDRLHTETVPAGPEPLKSVVPALAPGEYFARVRAVDAAGLLGRASAVRRVEVLRVKTQRATLGPQGLQGTSPLEFSVDGAESLDARLDGAPVALPLRVEAPGAHTLELRPRGLPDAPPERLTLTVSPPKATLALEPLGDAFQARLRVFDEQGQPVELDPTALTLRGLEGTWVDALSRQTDGSWLALVVPSERDGRLVSVEALWGDTPLARLQTEVPAPVAPLRRLLLRPVAPRWRSRPCWALPRVGGATPWPCPPPSCRAPCSSSCALRPVRPPRAWTSWAGAPRSPWRDGWVSAWPWARRWRRVPRRSRASCPPPCRAGSCCRICPPCACCSPSRVCSRARRSPERRVARGCGRR